MDVALLVDPQHRGQHLGGEVLHLATGQLHHLFQRFLLDHRLEHAALQHLVDLHLGDVGEHGHGASQLAAGIEHRVGGALAPDALAILGTGDFLGVVGLSFGQLPAYLLDTRRTEVGSDHGDRRAADDLLLGIAEQSAEAGVHVGGPPLHVSDQHSMVGVVHHQRQQVELGAFLVLAGDVLDEGRVDDLPLRLDLGDRHGAPAAFPVGTQDGHIQAATDDPVDPGAAVGLDVAVVALPELRRHQRAYVVAEHLVAPQPPELLRRPVEEDDAIVAVDDHDTVDCLLQGLYEDLG